MALTDTVINKIIRCECFAPNAIRKTYRARILVTVQTGLITALCAIIDLVLFLVSVRHRSRESSYENTPC